MISNFGHEINYTPYFVPKIPFVNSGTKSTEAHFSCPNFPPTVSITDSSNVRKRESRRRRATAQVSHVR